MGQQHIAGLVLAAAAMSVAPAATGIAADQKPVFDLHVTGLQEWSPLPKKFAGNDPRFGCDGGNTSPPLAWSNPPANAKSFAIVLFDPMGNPPLGFVHWVAYDIPATMTGLKEGEGSQPSSAFKGGKNSLGADVYFGPCPPAAEKAHPFTFILMATDLAPGTLAAGMTREELAAALKGHIVGRTTLVQRYGGD
jgi:Raf kinase inhibitor-like YbhB/YbcL family protein